MRRLVILAAAAVFSVFGPVVVGSPGAAAPPEPGSFSFPEHASHPAGSLCAFPVFVSQVSRGSYDVYVDDHGRFSRMIVRISYEATVTGNDRTVVERDVFTRTLHADGVVRDVGATAHLQGPGGVVLVDPGAAASRGTATADYVRGPQIRMSRAALCPALGGQANATGLDWIVHSK